MFHYNTPYTNFITQGDNKFTFNNRQNTERCAGSLESNHWDLWRKYLNKHGKGPKQLSALRGVVNRGVFGEPSA